MIGPEGRSRGRALLLWSIFAPCLLTAWIAVVVLPRRSWRWRALHLLSRLVFRAWGVSFSRTGAEFQTPDGPGIVFAANHSSYFDLLAIAAGASHGAALRRKISTVAAGDSILVFPEGTFFAKPGLRRFQMGAFTAAAMAGAPLVPIAISGTRSLLPKGCLRPYPGALTVAFGPALTAPGNPAADGDPRKQARALHDRTRAFILEKTGEEDMASAPQRGPAPT